MADLQKFQQAFLKLTNHKVDEVFMKERHKEELKDLEKKGNDLRKELQEHCPHLDTDVKGDFDYYNNVNERYQYCTLCNKTLEHI